MRCRVLAALLAVAAGAAGAQASPTKAGGVGRLPEIAFATSHFRAMNVVVTPTAALLASDFHFSFAVPSALPVTRVWSVPDPYVAANFSGGDRRIVSSNDSVLSVLHNPSADNRWDGKARTEPNELLPAVAMQERSIAELKPLARAWRTKTQLLKLAGKERGPDDRFRFAVIGDAEPGRFWFSRMLFNKPGIFWKLLAHADHSGSDFILQLGDMVSRGTAAHFKAFLRSLSAVVARTPYLTVIGNHDRHRPHGVTNDHLYRAAFGSPDYSFTRGRWRFVVVDSSAGRLTAVQLQWLSRELDPNVPTVVFTHIPPAPLSEWTDWGILKGVGGFKEGSEDFMRLMSANKVARVYMGHIHGLGTLVRGGVKYVLTGGGGSPLFPGPVKQRLHHWLSVEAGADGLIETVHSADGGAFPLL